MGCGCSTREEVEVLEEGVQEVMSRSTHISAGQADLTITLTLVPERAGLRGACSRATHRLPSPTTTASSISPIPSTSPDHKPRSLTYPNKKEFLENNIHFVEAEKPPNITNSSKAKDYRKEVACMVEDLGLGAAPP